MQDPCKSKNTPPSTIPTAQSALAAPARLVVRDAVAGSDVDASFRVISSNTAAHPLLDLTGHCEESLFDVASILGRGLEEGDTKAVGELLSGGLPELVLFFVSADWFHKGRAYLGDCVLHDLLV